MAFTNIWDDTVPADSQLASLGAQDFRTLRLDIQQRMGAISGLSAAKPDFGSDATPSNWTGVLFFATDTSHVFQWSGSAWVDVTAGLLPAVVPDGCRVYNSANLTIHNNTDTPLTFNSERYDNGGLHSTSVNTSRLTAVKTGTYLITGHVEWSSSSPSIGAREIKIYLNHATVIADEQIAAITTSLVVTTQSIATLYHLTATNYVELVVSHNQGVSLVIDAVPNYSPEFAMQLVGA